MEQLDLIRRATPPGTYYVGEQPAGEDGGRIIVGLDPGCDRDRATAVLAKAHQDGTVEILDVQTAPFQAHSAESAAAAESMQPHLSALQAEILALLRKRGSRGATDNELIELSGRQGSTVRPRRIELLSKGLIERRGQRRTKSGRKAAVWVAL